LFFRKKTKIKKSLFRKIVNGFLYFGIGILTALMILFAISQTSTFRDWLKEKVVTTVNGSINGNLSIESIDGTIFTSVILNNTLLLQGKDTLFSAEEIELRTSPLELVFKTIYLRKFKITNAAISLIKDENGNYNISKLSKSETTEGKTKETATTGFDYKIQVADLSFNDVNFKMQSFNNKNSTVIYDNLNGDDFRLSHIDLSLNAFINLAANDVRVAIRNFSAKPNLKGFRLNNLSGNFLIDNEDIGLTGMKIVTDRSNILLSAAAKDFPILSGKEIQLEKVLFRLDLNAQDFNFDDLTNFIPATELLSGTVKTEISAHGSLNDLTLRHLDISFNDSRIQGIGNIKKVMNGAEMFVDMNFVDTYFNPADPDSLLRNIDIPVYNDFGTLTFDSLFFKGKPLNFNAGMKVRTDRGDFDGNIMMDLTEADMVYDINLFTQNLDLYPVINLSTNLNSHITLKGKGTSPDRMNSNITLAANRSEIKNKKYENLSFNLTASNGNIEHKVFFKSDRNSGTISGGIDFSNLNKPVYNLEAALNNFNLADFVPGSVLETNLNLDISADGSSFNQDSLEVFAVIGIDSSKIGDIQLDDTKLIIDLRNDLNGGRVINLVSNLADITLTGNFSVLDIATIIQTESLLITDFVSRNLNRINPAAEMEPVILNTDYVLPDEAVAINYSVEFKDFQILSLFLGEADLEVDGDINGVISRKGDLLSLSLGMDVNYFQYLKAGELYFSSGLKLNAVLSNDFSIPFPESFKSDIDLSVHELFLANKLRNVSLNLFIEHENIALKCKGDFEDYFSTNFSGDILLSDDAFRLVLDSLYLKYYDFDLWNLTDVDIAYSGNQINFNNFKMTHNPGDIELSGHYSLSDESKLALKITNLQGKDLSDKIFYLPPGTSFISEINMAAYWQGSVRAPLLNMNLTADNIKIRDKKLGSLLATAFYDVSGLKFDISILDTLYNINNPILKAEGIFPVNLARQNEKSTKNQSDIKLSLISNGFDLRMIGGAVTHLRDLQGELDASIEISGNTDNPEYSGNAELKDVSFILKANNIKYDAHANVTLSNKNIFIDNVYIKNVEGTVDGGTVFGSGTISHKELELNEINFTANGQLKILSKDTRAVNPTIFGNLSIQSRGDISYSYNNLSSMLKADLLIKHGAQVTISPGPTAFSNSSDKLIYRHKKYYSSLNGESIIDSLLSISNELGQQENAAPAAPNNLNLQIKINVEDEAKMVFELSPEFKQNLTAYLGGGFEYNIIDNIPVVHGELTLLEGSKLDFIKTFDAAGSVKFFEELDDPFLDITASYQDYYLQSSDTTGTGNGDKEVEIRIRLQGPLKELNRNFIKQEGNISVYLRENTLSDFQLDATKTSSDALMFIIVGKFTDDATTQDKNFAASTATSFAGSLVGGFLNEKFGDYIRSVRFQQIGADTKISLIGKVDLFKYEIGGTSQVFQDLSRANVKIEASPFKNLKNLIFRVQRRDPFLGTSSYGDMINEFGVKYRFDF
jgi:hypothetical protein